jgi:hypothetical protein
MIANGKQAIRLARDYGDYTKVTEFASAAILSAIAARKLQGVAAGSRSALLKPPAQTLRAADVTTFASKQAAREALDGPLGVAANRFFRDAAKNAQDFRVIELAGNGKKFEFFSPAKTAGYGKRYVQEVDSVGVRVREYKDSMGPNGVYKTKWIFGGP